MIDVHIRRGNIVIDDRGLLVRERTFKSKKLNSNNLDKVSIKFYTELYNKYTIINTFAVSLK